MTGNALTLHPAANKLGKSTPAKSPAVRRRGSTKATAVFLPRFAPCGVTRRGSAALSGRTVFRLLLRRDAKSLPRPDTTVRGLGVGRPAARLKGVVAHRVNSAIGSSGSIWQEESYDRIVRDDEHLWRVSQYIGRNPRLAGVPPNEWRRWIHPLIPDVPAPLDLPVSPARLAPMSGRKRKFLSVSREGTR